MGDAKRQTELLFLAAFCSLSIGTRPLEAQEEPWPAFRNRSVGVEFHYPARFLAVTIQNKERNVAGDSLIALQLQQLRTPALDSTISFRSLTFYVTNASFDSVARAEGFDRGFEDDEFNEDSLVSKRSRGADDWVLLGRQGMRRKAELVHWGMWRGLQGNNFTGVFHKEGGYAGLADFEQLFVYRAKADGAAVVVSFYDGPQGDVEDPAPDPTMALTKDELRKIVLSTKFLSGNKQ